MIAWMSGGTVDETGGDAGVVTPATLELPQAAASVAAMSEQQKAAALKRPAEV
jgi:hypothetical protein